MSTKHARVRIEFCDRDYLFSHGRSPRGFGSWVFEPKDVPFGMLWFHQMTYAQAKRACVARLRELVSALNPPDGASVLVEVCT